MRKRPLIAGCVLFAGLFSTAGASAADQLDAAVQPFRARMDDRARNDDRPRADAAPQAAEPNRVSPPAAQPDTGAAPAAGQPLFLAEGLDSPPGYRGGRGLITLQGMSGMFLNPTSGTLDQGQLTLQYCLFMNDYDTDIVGHGLMVDYGVTDWLNIGAFGTAADLPNQDLGLFDNPVAAGGPFVRARLVKEQGWVPELSVGGIYTDGDSDGDIFSKAEAFVAASKGFEIDEDGVLRSVRFHLGYRYASRTEAPGFPDESFVYGGVEVELPYGFYIVGELSSNNLNERGSEDLPYAVGVQWKPTGVVGISVAHMNPSVLGLSEGFWFGIGLNFKL